MKFFNFFTLIFLVLVAVPMVNALTCNNGIGYCNPNLPGLNKEIINATYSNFSGECGNAQTLLGYTWLTNPYFDAWSSTYNATYAQWAYNQSDNLGNHQATQDLNMTNHGIINTPFVNSTGKLTLGVETSGTGCGGWACSVASGAVQCNADWGGYGCSGSCSDIGGGVADFCGQWSGSDEPTCVGNGGGYCAWNEPTCEATTSCGGDVFVCDTFLGSYCSFGGCSGADCAGQLTEGDCLAMPAPTACTWDAYKNEIELNSTLTTAQRINAKNITITEWGYIADLVVGTISGVMNFAQLYTDGGLIYSDGAGALTSTSITSSSGTIDTLTSTLATITTLVVESVGGWIVGDSSKYSRSLSFRAYNPASPPNIIDTNYGLTIFNENSSLGAEKITNGNMGSSTGWTVGSNWVINSGGNGVAVKYSDGLTTLNQTSANMQTPLVVGEMYRLAWSFKAGAGGVNSNWNVSIGGISFPTIFVSTSGTGSYSPPEYVRYFVATGTQALSFQPLTTGSRQTLDDVSLKRVTTGSLVVMENITIMAMNGTANALLCVNSVGSFYRGNATGCP